MLCVAFQCGAGPRVNAVLFVRTVGRRSRYNRGTPDLYPLPKPLTKIPYHSSLFAPALSGEAARPRAATLPIIDVLNYASGKAGGRCAPRLLTAVLGLAARGRPAAPDAVA